MISKVVIAGIIVGVFFAGVGISYAIFASTYDPNTMKFQNQEMFDQMMSQNPKMTQQWMDTGMMENSPIMQSWMNTMMNDPEVGQEIMKQMMQNPEMMSGMMGSGMGQGMMGSGIEDQPLYNEVLNPNQIEYPNIVGFNDLHIEAIRHLQPNGDDTKLDVIVHHHCKLYDDMTAACLLFPTGMEDQDKPYGMEYVITSEHFEELSDEEKLSWHYHLTELPRAKAVLPDLTSEELAEVQPVLDETYGKVFYFWDFDEKYPIGEPSVLVIQDLPSE